MTVASVCHTIWEQDGRTHVCGRLADHPASWHLCACGTMLLQNGASPQLSDRGDDR